MNIDRLNRVNVVLFVIVFFDALVTFQLLAWYTDPVYHHLVKDMVIGYEIDTKMLKATYIVKTTMVVAIAILYGENNNE